MAKKNIHADKDIKVLDLDPKVNKVLYDNEINTIGILWELNKKKLKELGLTDSEIKMISIKMQLLGIDLNKRVYN